MSDFFLETTKYHATHSFTNITIKVPMPFSQKTNENIYLISSLASKKRLNKKIKSRYPTYILGTI